jgi:hypothetical protein
MRRWTASGRNATLWYVMRASCTALHAGYSAAEAARFDAGRSRTFGGTVRASRGAVGRIGVANRTRASVESRRPRLAT